MEATKIANLYQLSDEDLMEQLQNGVAPAFDIIVHRFQDRLHNFLYRYTHNHEDCEDLVQETFLRVYRSRYSYQRIAKLSTWIYTIASNLLKNEYRNRSRRRETAFSDLRSDGSDARPVEFESKAEDPERNAYRGELREAIEEAIGQMEEHHRIPFVMREVEDRTYEEISEAIGVPVGTVKSRLFRARNAFQALLPVSLS